MLEAENIPSLGTRQSARKYVVARKYCIKREVTRRSRFGELYHNLCHVQGESSDVSFDFVGLPVKPELFLRGVQLHEGDVSPLKGLLATVFVHSSSSFVQYMQFISVPSFGYLIFSQSCLDSGIDPARSTKPNLPHSWFSL